MQCLEMSLVCELRLIILLIMGLIESLQRRRAQGGLGAAVRT